MQMNFTSTLRTPSNGPGSDSPNYPSKRESSPALQSESSDVPVSWSQRKTIGVFTSGGDSQGMNAALRGVVRMGLYMNCRVFFIKEGYQGMVNGGGCLVEATWLSVTNIIHKGGTVIGSARCPAFLERAGRLKAAHNLIEHQITNLVVIGGDGSLTGADLFRREWTSLVDELQTTNQITRKQACQCAHLNIVGMVGSIDNDFSGTDMTIGTDSALHRIMETIDSIVPTATSHQRTFILEIMGRHCGYLALVAGIASEADFVFIPECPPAREWRKTLVAKIEQERRMGKRLNIILISEGAIDEEGVPITAETVKGVIQSNTDYQDIRITVLGHVQRGGNPNSFDRILGSVMGAAATRCLVEAAPGAEACVITLIGNQVLRLPLMECVEKTKTVAAAVAAKQWDRVMTLRGTSFQRNWATYNLITDFIPPSLINRSPYSFRLAAMHCGSPCCGMNAAVRSFVRNCIIRGDTLVLGIHDGFDGLIDGNVHPLGWTDVSGWVGQGGAELGTRSTLPNESNMNRIVESLRRFRIQALLVVGGFEAYNSVLKCAESRPDHPELNIPLCVIPATISNNVPGTDFSIGTDTALNAITAVCDRINQSAQGTRSVFIVETMGGYCGYLATLAGLAGGADATYIYEEPFNINNLVKDIQLIESKMKDGIQRGLVLRNENANPNYTTDFIYHLFAEEGKDIFSTRQNVLGHTQQGGYPSPFDRKFGTKLAAKAAHWLLAQLDSANSKPLPDEMDGNAPVMIYNCSLPDTAVVLGLVGQKYQFTPVQDLKKETDFVHRIPKTHWFHQLRPLLRILAHHNSDYTTDPQRSAVRNATLLVDA